MMHAPCCDRCATRVVLARSVALPEWFFSKDKNRAPIILLVLLFGGIVTPLVLAAVYLTRSNKWVQAGGGGEGGGGGGWGGIEGRGGSGQFRICHKVEQEALTSLRAVVGVLRGRGKGRV